MTAKLVDFGVSMLLDSTTAATTASEAQAATGEIGISETEFGITMSDDTGSRPASSPPVSLNSSAKSGGTARDGRTTGRDRISGRPVDLTQTGVIMGTPLYMAPELRQGAKFARPSSDVFSFGVMAYEVLSGQLPSEQPALFHNFQSGKPWFTPLRTKAPEIPSQIADIIERCLDPQPEARPTAAQVKAALAAR